MKYDVVIAGGSVAGLLCAREIAGRHSVLVVEEDYEIGTPEHCGGMVSSEGLGELGIVPLGKTIGHAIEAARVHAPDGGHFAINARKQGVIQLDRRELDKQIAHQAQKKGAEIHTRTSMQGVTDRGVKTDKGEIQCRILVDARGISSLVQRDRSGILQSAQYEIYADWIRRGRVEIYLDSEKFPGFFAWTIPYSDGRGRVGLAGRGINAANALDRLLESRNVSSVIRKIYAPIWTKGPIGSFVSGEYGNSGGRGWTGKAHHCRRDLLQWNGGTAGGKVDIAVPIQFYGCGSCHLPKDVDAQVWQGV